MKTTRLKIGSLLLAAGVFVFALGTITSSCTKTNTVTKTVVDSIPYTPAPVPPSNPDNLTDANGVDSTNLVAYWNFDGNTTEQVESLQGTGTNVIYSDGVKKQCYQGTGGSYVVYTNPGTALPTLGSFSLAFWMKANQPIGNPSSFVASGLGAQGMFDIVNSTGFWGNLHVDLEPNPSAGTADSANGYVGTPNPDTLLMKIELTSVATGVVWQNQFPTILLPGAVGMWTHVAITYNGASGLFTVYENGAPVSFTGAYGYAYGPFNSAITLYANDPGGATNPNSVPVLGNLQFTNASAVVIGAWQLSTTPSLTSGAGGQPWASNYTGALDEFRIYSNALTANDVQSLYLLEKAGF
jgi:hypothetical protein